MLAENVATEMTKLYFGDPIVSWG